MPHKYLNDIGIKSNDCCVFNTEEIDNGRQEYFIEQRQIYGFDERETWSMDYTFATWLYEHLQAYKEFAKGNIDLEFHKILIPVLYDIPEDKSTYINEGKTIVGQYKYEIIEEHTELEAIDIMVDYLKKYFNSVEFDDLEYQIKNESIKREYLQGAIGILKEVIPALWW